MQVSISSGNIGSLLMTSQGPSCQVMCCLLHAFCIKARCPQPKKNCLNLWGWARGTKASLGWRDGGHIQPHQKRIRNAAETKLTRRALGILTFNQNRISNVEETEMVSSAHPPTSTTQQQIERGRDGGEMEKGEGGKGQLFCVWAGGSAHCLRR